MKKTSGGDEFALTMAGSLTDQQLLPQFVEQVRATFCVRSAAVLRQDGDVWHIEASSGEPVPAAPGDADVCEPLGTERVLALTGRSVAAEDTGYSTLSAQAALVLEARRLQTEAARAFELALANVLRAGLLQAVSHDLRTPLASIKASITSLRQSDIRWDLEQVDEFFATIDYGAGAGVGLGLAIARSFTEAMGGELTVEDTPGGETTMVVALTQYRAADR